MQESPHRFWLCHSPATGNSRPLYPATQRAFCDRGTGDRATAERAPSPHPGCSCSEGNEPPEGGGERIQSRKGLNFHSSCSRIPRAGRGTGLPPSPHLVDAVCLLGTALQLPPQFLALSLQPLVLPQDSVRPGQAAAGRHGLGTDQRLHTGRTQRARAQRQEGGRDRAGQDPAGPEESIVNLWQGGRAACNSSIPPSTCWCHPRGGGRLWEVPVLLFRAGKRSLSNHQSRLVGNALI